MNKLEEALHSLLSGDAQLISLLGGTAIYNTILPRSVDLPAVIFSLSSGIEENMTPTRSIGASYLVKGMTNTLSEAQSIADRIDALLHDATLSVSGWNNFWSARESLVSYLEVDESGAFTAHAGAVYNLRIEEV